MNEIKNETFDSYSGGMLGMDRIDQQERVRTIEIEREDHVRSQTHGDFDDRVDSSQDRCLPQVRQQEVHSTGPSISGNAQGQHAGREEEGTSEKRRGGNDSLQERSRVHDGKYSHKQEECPSLHPLSKLESAGESRGTQEKSREVSSVSTSQTGTKSEIQAEESGVLVGSSFTEQYRLARAYSASGLMPATLNTPEKVLVALQLCHELGLRPMTSMSKIAVINGSPALFGDLPLALVMKSGLLENIEETIEMDTQGKDPIVATCAVKRKGIDIPIIRSFSQEDAKRADLWGKRVWKPFPKRMMQMRARSHALKDGFADVLMGIQLVEYDANILIDSETTQPINTRSSSLNEKFAPNPVTNSLTDDADHAKKNEHVT